MIERLSDAFSRYHEYEILLGRNQRFQEALGSVYYDVLVFLKKAKKIFTARGLMTITAFGSIAITYDLERVQIFVQESLEELRDRFPSRA